MNTLPAVTTASIREEVKKTLYRKMIDGSYTLTTYGSDKFLGIYATENGVNSRTFNTVAEAANFKFHGVTTQLHAIISLEALPLDYKLF